MEITTRAAIEKAATIKAVKGATAELLPGVYEVDETFRVRGTITKGEDYGQTVWPSVPLLDVLVRLLNVSGCVQRTAFEAAVKAVLDGEKAVLRDEKGKPVNLSKWAEEAVKMLAEAGHKVCTGKTTCSLTVEPVAIPYAVDSEPEPEPAAR